MLRILFSIILIAFSLQISARNKDVCLDELTFEDALLKIFQLNGVEYKVKAFGEDIPQDLVRDVIKQYQEVNEFVKGELLIPADIEIDILTTHNNASYSIYEDLHLVPLRLTKQIQTKTGGRELAKHPIHTFPVHRHEWGHELFYHNLKSKYPFLEPYIGLMEKDDYLSDVIELLEHNIALLKKEKKKLEKRIITGSAVTDGEIALTAIGRKIKKVNAFNQVVRLLNTNPRKIGDFLTSSSKPSSDYQKLISLAEKIHKTNQGFLGIYKNLRSDGELNPGSSVVEIAKLIDVYDEDFEVITELLDEVSEAIDVYAFRSVAGVYNELFADLVAIVSLNDGSAVAKALQFAGDESKAKKGFIARDYARNHKVENWHYSTAHRMLAPVGSYVWKWYFSNPIYAKNRAKLLRIMLDVMGELIIQKINPQNQRLNGDQSIEDLNWELINAFDKRVREEIML